MHFLLIPYVLLSSMFVVQFNDRGKAGARGGLVVTAGVTILMLFLAMLLRPAQGDSWRYLQYFLDVRSLSLSDAMTYHDSDAFYAALNWLLGRLGDEQWLLFGSTLLIYMGLFTVAIRRVAGQIGAAVLIMAYAAFPFFIAYAANGLRQGLALAFLLMAYVNFHAGRRSAWVWLLLAPFWHSGAWLAVAVVSLHHIMCRIVINERMRWALVLCVLMLAMGLSIVGLNEDLVSVLPSSMSLDARYDVYFEEADKFGYQAGFRADFALFSLLPLLTACLLRRKAQAFNYAGNGWWLSLYLSLNIIYHLFSFAPFADRFAAFSWILIPLVIYLQVLATRSRSLMTAFVSLIILVNAAMLQLYTGGFISPPQWWI